MMIETLAQLGAYIRQRREAQGLTLDVVSSRANISKPYLSNIETARAPGPPSVEMLVRIEETLGFEPEELQRAADWLRTPEAIRDLIRSGVGPRRADGALDLDQTMGKTKAAASGAGPQPAALKAAARTPAEVLRPVGVVPLINRVAAGNATEFTDLDYPVGVADSYVPLPEQAGLGMAGTFALRVSGDSMEPEYHEGDLVIVTSTPPKQGDICLVRLGAADNFATTLKRAEFVSGAAHDRVDPEQAEAVRLVPLNPRHAVRVVAMEEVTGIFPVQWKMTAVKNAAATPAPAEASEIERGTFDLAQD